MNLARNKFIPLIDGTLGAESGVYQWVRIDKSTVFELSFNPSEETSGYIDAANDSTYIKSYAPELPQEIILDNENPLYKVMFPFCMSMPTGSSATVPCALVVPNMTTGAATDAYVWTEAVISPQALNTVDGILSFTLKLNGDAALGTMAVKNGEFVFTPSGEVVTPGTGKDTGDGTEQG